MSKGIIHLWVLVALFLLLITSVGFIYLKYIKQAKPAEISSRIDDNSSSRPLSSIAKQSPSDSPIADSSNEITYEMKVLVLKYFPLTNDRKNIDIATTGDVGVSYSEIRLNTETITKNLAEALNKASIYLGYKNSLAVSSLSYKIIDTKVFEQGVPMLNNGSRKPDYYTIMLNNNICNYVENQGVSEVWLWAYQGPVYPGANAAYLSISESKMAGPFGDISNSWREDNMPKCSKTYRVYTFNYGRGTAEAMESWGHQFEAELRAVDNNLLNLFQGPNYPQTLNQVGRCGSVHNPPNARSEYDRANRTSQKSDCLDWNADSIGATTEISCINWGCEDKGDSYNASLNYMIWNWQNLPGENNDKTFQGKKLRNWWVIHGDFDNVMRNNSRLTL